MYDQIRGDLFFIMLYAGVTAMALMASCYLLFRDGNAFAADIKTPVRLRRWVAAYFASIYRSEQWAGIGTDIRFANVCVRAWGCAPVANVARR